MWAKTSLYERLLAISRRQNLLLLLHHCLLLHPTLVLLVYQHWLLLLEYHLLSLRWRRLGTLRSKPVTLHLPFVELHVILNLLTLESTTNKFQVTCINVLSVDVLVLLLIIVKPLPKRLCIFINLLIIKLLTVHLHLHSIQLLLTWLNFSINFLSLHVVTFVILEVFFIVLNALHGPHINDLISSLDYIFFVVEFFVIWDDILHLLVAHKGS